MMSMKFALLALAASLLPGALLAQLPEGPGRDETIKMCRTCHEVARSVSKRQDRDGWVETMNKMVAFGMKSSEQDYNTVLDYLAKHYPAEDVPRVNVNSAPAIELESILALRRSQAAAMIAYREQHGPFRTLEDLKKVPNIDPAKIDAKKDRIRF
jgi:competence protein ComEA